MDFFNGNITAASCRTGLQCVGQIHLKGVCDAQLDRFRNVFVLACGRRVRLPASSLALMPLTRVLVLRPVYDLERRIKDRKAQLGHSSLHEEDDVVEALGEEAASQCSSCLVGECLRERCGGVQAQTGP